MSNPNTKIKYNFYTSAFIRLLVFFISILLITHCLSIYLLIEFPNAKDDGSFYGKLIQLFNFDIEANLPTFFSSLLLLLNGLLLSFIAYTHRKTKTKYLPWVGMAFIFFFLSLDEMITIHEHLIQPTRDLFGTSGYLYYAWIIPYGILAILLGIVYSRFLLRLPKRVLLLFILAAVVFLSGAIGMESISAMQHDQYGMDNIVYHMMYTVEELLEMSGSTIFCFALLTYIGITFKSFSLKFQQTPEIKSTPKVISTPRPVYPQSLIEA